MTAEPLATAPVAQSILAEFDLMQQVAAAAVGHPGGRPWRVWPLDHGVEIRAVSRHALPDRGPGVQTVRITAGAAVLNIRLAIAALGHRPMVGLLPGLPRRPRNAVLAVLRQGATAEPSAQERALFDAVAPVGRNLAPLDDRLLPAPVLHRARAAAEAEGVWLRTIDQHQRGALAARFARIAEHPANAQLVVIGSNHDIPVMHLRAGLALQRIVLTARVLGATAAVVAWPAELAAAAPLPPPMGDRGLCPQLIVALGAPATVQPLQED